MFVNRVGVGLYVEFRDSVDDNAYVEIGVGLGVGSSVVPEDGESAFADGDGVGWLDTGPGVGFELLGTLDGVGVGPVLGRMAEDTEIKVVALGSLPTSVMLVGAGDVPGLIEQSPIPAIAKQRIDAGVGLEPLGPDTGADVDGFVAPLGCTTVPIADEVIDCGDITGSGKSGLLIPLKMLTKLPPTPVNKPAPTPGSRPVPKPTPRPLSPGNKPPPTPTSPPATPTPDMATDVNVPPAVATDAEVDTAVVGPDIQPVDVMIDVGNVGISPSLGNVGVSPPLGSVSSSVCSPVSWPAGAGTGGVVSSSSIKSSKS